MRKALVAERLARWKKDPQGEAAEMLKKAYPPIVARKPKPNVASERDVQNTCIEFLKLDGWRIIVTDPQWMRGMGVTEPGIADTLAIRYGSLPRLFTWLLIVLPPKVSAVLLRVFCEALWIEWKRPKGSKTQQNQHDWHAAERARGALTIKAGEDFEPTIEGFADWYNKSGLAINKMQVGAKR